MWLLLIHQIPSKPDYLRVKIGRRLARVGAIAVKSSVYVLPMREQAREDFQWILQEIRAGGGEGTLCEARFIEGLDDAGVIDLFRAARDAEWAALAEEARALQEPATPEPSAVARLRRRHDEIAAIDFFEASGQLTAAALLSALEARLRGTTEEAAPAQDWRGRVWVTRAGIKVDRMACAWLIRRFIDPDARFKFAPPQGCSPQPGEIRFDMFEAEFTHEGEQCSFEVMRRRLVPDAPGLGDIAEIVHDIDLKDARFGRAEAPGLALVIDAIAAAHPADEDRLARACALFDDLHAAFRRRGR